MSPRTFVAFISLRRRVVVAVSASLLVAGFATVAAPAAVAGSLSIKPAHLPNPTAGTLYSYAVTAADGISPYMFAESSGALPPGLTLASTGILSGTPTQTGTFAFSVTATDASPSPATVSQSYVVAVAPPAITIGPATLPTASQYVAYSRALVGHGGTAPYTYSMISGALPPGLAFNGGLITGTPTAVGAYAFTVSATDSTIGLNSPYSGSRTFSLTVGPTTIPSPTITWSAHSYHGLHHGWYRSPVTVAFRCRVRYRGVAVMCPTDVVLSTNTRGVIVTQTATDNVGGSASVTAGPFRIDQTPPTLTVHGLRNGATYWHDPWTAASCVGHDKLSGVQGRCVLHRRVRSGTVVVTAVVHDRANNHRIRHLRYRLAG